MMMPKESENAALMVAAAMIAVETRRHETTDAPVKPLPDQDIDSLVQYTETAYRQLMARFFPPRHG